MSTGGPPMFLIVAAVVATLVTAAVLLGVLRAARREQRGFDIKPTPPESAPAPPRQNHIETPPRIG